MIASRLETPRWSYWAACPSWTIWQGVNLYHRWEPVPSDQLFFEPLVRARLKQLFDDYFANHDVAASALSLFDAAQASNKAWHETGKGLASLGIRGVPNRWAGNTQVRRAAFVQLAERAGFSTPSELRGESIRTGTGRARMAGGSREGWTSHPRPRAEVT